MNIMCETCRHYWYDTTNRRDVSCLFAKARARLEAEGNILRELNALERQCARLSEVHHCTVDGIEPCMEQGENECELWEAA